MSRTDVQDEILYCARCGISFLWTQEEQKGDSQASAPSHCPACQRLLPATGRERGLVKWYDPRKQYGFLVRAAQPDIYVHRSGMLDTRVLRPGDLVEFAVADTPRGPAAVAVAIVTPAS